MAFVAPHGAPETAPFAHGTFMVLRLVQLVNALLSILVGVPVNVIDVKPVHSPNAFLPMLVIPLGNEVRAKLAQR